VLCQPATDSARFPWCGEILHSITTMDHAARPETLYDVLGLDHRTCDLADIKSAYRTQARMHHPDRVAPENKEESTIIFRKLTEAYEILSDGPKKLRYDSSMGLYRKRPSNVSEEAGNYFNKNTVGKKVSPAVKKSGRFRSKSPGGRFKKKRPSDVDLEAGQGDKQKGNFLTNAFGKTRTKTKRPSEVAAENGNYFGKFNVQTSQGLDSTEPINDRTPEPAAPNKRTCCSVLPVCKIKKCSMPTCKIKNCKLPSFDFCRMLCDMKDLDSITVFTMISVLVGAVFFVGVMVTLLVVHVI